MKTTEKTFPILAPMDELNLPNYDAAIKRTGDTLSIYDNLRKKFVVLTPEEWVRQHFLNFLMIT